MEKWRKRYQSYNTLVSKFALLNPSPAVAGSDLPRLNFDTSLPVLIEWVMILGIDPGLENTGWAVVDGGNLVGYGMVKVGKGDERLKDLYEELEKIIKKFGVTEVAFESLFFAKNARSAMAVSEAVGVIKLAAMRCGLEVVGYTPLQVKMALTGYGRAEKEQVETMVRSCLNLEEAITPSHAADAAAVALTHGFTMKV